MPEQRRRAAGECFLRLFNLFQASAQGQQQKTEQPPSGPTPDPRGLPSRCFTSPLFPSARKPFSRGTAWEGKVEWELCPRSPAGFPKAHLTCTQHRLQQRPLPHRKCSVFCGSPSEVDTGSLAGTCRTTDKGTWSSLALCLVEFSQIKTKRLFLV